MQVNRLSMGLQEQLKQASNFNTARNETLFDKEKFGIQKDDEIDFSSLNVEDLDITEEKIGNLLNGFAEEVVNVFSNKMPDLLADNPLRTNDSANNKEKPVFTA